MRRPIVPSIVVFLLVVGACTAEEAPSRVEAADEPLATATSPHALASEPIRILRTHQVHGFRSIGVDGDENARDNLAVGADGLLHIVANFRTSLGIGWPVWLTLDPEAPSPVSAMTALISPAESALVANGIATSSTSDDLFIHSFDFRRFDGGRLVQRYDTSSRAMVAERWIPGSVSGRNPVRWAAAHGGARATGGQFMGFEGNLDSIDNGANAYGAPHPYLYNAPTRQSFQVQDARVRFVGAHGGVIFDRYDGGDALWGAIEPAGTRAFSLVSQQVNPCSPILPCYRWGMAVRSYDIASHAGIANWEEPVNDQRLPAAGIVLLDPSTGGVVIVGEYRSPSDPLVRELYVTRLSRELGVLSPTTRISVSTPYFRLRDVLIDSDGTLIIGLYQRTLVDFFALRVIGPQGQDRGTLAMAPVEAEGVSLKRGPDGKIYLLANEGDSIVVYEMVRDTDGDGLPDAWEMGPLDFDGDGITDIDLAALGADPMHKDIFLEIDAMDGTRDPSLFVPYVVAAFEGAAVNNPDGITGIHLWPIFSDLHIPRPLVYAPSMHASFKDDWFGDVFDRASLNPTRLAVRRRVMRYLLVAHEWTTRPGIAGMALAVPGRASSNLMVFTSARTVVAASSTFAADVQEKIYANFLLHELGHTLGLRHGGTDDDNHKPNYHSVMNYLHQLPVPGWEQFFLVDFARTHVPSLDENSLDEGAGLGFGPEHAGHHILFLSMVPTSTHVGIHFVDETVPWIDFDRDGLLDASPVAVDINEDFQNTVLHANSDWSNLDWSLWLSPGWDGGLLAQEVVDDSAALMVAAGWCDLSVNPDCTCTIEGATQACSSNVGVCRVGVQRCTGGFWGLCVGGVAPREERCDGLDNDCDGVTDETFATLGQACTAGVSTCERAGVLVCGADRASVTCSAEPGPPATELCGNGVDDDCDGDTDEGFPTLGSSCSVGVGSCARSGLLECAGDGLSVECSAAPGAPVAELCDGLDNDCDGRIDETFGDLRFNCSVGVGGCRRSGVYVCNASHTDEVCSVSPGTPGTELCGNTVDDDCDGAVDEGFSGLGSACSAGVGVCVRSGVLQCSVDRLTTACSASPGAPVAELCDGLDNDCDGATDETFGVGSGCTVGVGVCARSGTLSCAASHTAAQCSATAGAPGTESCDGLDNDCDGLTDEAFADLGLGCKVGIGSCSRTGSLQCSADGLGVACSASPGAPAAELCDGIDNDCDGEFDETFALGSACSVGAGVCARSGTLRCSANPIKTECSATPGAPGAERCGNTMDDDCDGAVDEGFPIVGSTCTVGVGTCARSGAAQCTSDGLGSVCSGTAGAPGLEVCGDGLDNDCNGVADDLCPPRLISPPVAFHTGSARTTNVVGMYNPRQPTFRWASLGPTATYEFQIDLDHDRAIAVMSETTAATSYTHPDIGGRSAQPWGQHYYWRVRARLGSGAWGAWSPDRAIEIGRLPDDVNGDGYSDVLVGAPGESAGAAGEGRVHVFHGVAGGAPAAAATRILEDPNNQAQARFGTAVATADLDGDGYSDAIIGIPGRTNGARANAGEVVIYYGGSTRLGGNGATPTPPEVRIPSPAPEAGAGFGAALAPAGDVDADGYEDFWAAAPDQDVEIVWGSRFVVGTDAETAVVRTDVGAAYLFRGGPRGSQPTTAAMGWTGGAANARFGAALAVVGDVDQDGILEVAFGAPGTPSAPGVVVVRRGGLSADVISSPPIVLTLGNAVNFGRALAGGDFDGDGRGDLAVAAGGPTPVAIYRGTAAGGLDTWYAPLAGGSNGAHALAAGDADRDGRSDLAVGFAVEGRIDILRGGAAGPTFAVSWTGPQSGARAGAALTWADGEADGRWDLFAGAPRHDGPTVDQGRAYAWRQVGPAIVLGAPSREYAPAGTLVSGGFGGWAW